jgi:hypothetical protein
VNAVKSVVAVWKLTIFALVAPVTVTDLDAFALAVQFKISPLFIFVFDCLLITIIV